MSDISSIHTEVNVEGDKTKNIRLWYYLEQYKSLLTDENDVLIHAESGEQSNSNLCRDNRSSCSGMQDDVGPFIKGTLPDNVSSHDCNITKRIKSLNRAVGDNKHPIPELDIYKSLPTLDDNYSEIVSHPGKHSANFALVPCEGGDSSTNGDPKLYNNVQHFGNTIISSRYSILSKVVFLMKYYLQNNVMGIYNNMGCEIVIKLIVYDVLWRAIIKGREMFWKGKIIPGTTVKL